jgi:hypothetical protein
VNARAALANRLWLGASAPAHRRFRAALRRPREVQEEILRRHVRDNANTAFGREHDFARIASVADYRARVPLRDYDGLAPWVERAARGERGVLTRAPVSRFVPTGGSTGGSKWIPWTAALRREFSAAVGAWVSDLYGRDPALASGPAYWSITPPARPGAAPASRIPVGYDEDSEYLGGWMSPLIHATLAVPGGVAAASGIAEFRRATLLHLLCARDLRLVSVWHPTFLALLVDSMRESWPRLVADMAAGATFGPGVPGIPASRARAREMERLGPGDPARLWPGLRLISCWADAAAATHADGLKRLFPGVALQPKGLIATEAIVSIPYRGSHPLAVTSHFLEFVDLDGGIHLAADLEPRRSYSVVVTTGGGLHRYRLRDRVEVAGFVERTPCVRFLGKEDRVSDLRGEKLDEAFVTAAVRRVLDRSGVRADFALLAPETGPPGPRYVLFLSAPDVHGAVLGAELEAALRQDVQYAYAVDLGQLLPAIVVRVGPDASRRYVERLHALGARMGDVKPAALSTRDDWREVLAPPADRTEAAVQTTS